jgi:hypothetical protein
VDERARRWVARGRLVATVGLLVAVLWLVDLRAVGERLRHLQLRWIAAFLGLSVPLYLLYAWRWHFTAARVGAPVGYRRALADYYASTLLNQVLPVGVAGDLVRAARHGGRAVIFERLSGVLALALFVVASAGVWFWRGRDTFLGVGAGAAVLVGLALVGAAMARPGRSWLRALAGDAQQALWARGALAFQLAVSTATVAILLGMFTCAGRAAGVPFGLWTALQVVPLVLASTTVPWAFAGWGVREASTAALYRLMGLDAASGVAVSITFGVLSLLAAAPGVLALALPGRKEP